MQTLLTQACRSTPFTTPRRFRKNSECFVFKITRFVLVQSTATFRPRHSLIYCQSTKATLQGLTLFRFAGGGGRTTFNRQSGCCEIRCSRPPEARYFRRFFCWKYFVMELDFAGLLILLPPPRAKQSKISPPNKPCKERKNSSNS